MTLSKDCVDCDLQMLCDLIFLDVKDGEFVYCPDGTKHEVKEEV